MERIPEPEIMGAEEEARIYELADFSDVNQAFANRVLERTPSPQGVLIDLGCGPADILVRLAGITPGLFLIGLDGAKAMLSLAAKRIQQEGFHKKIFFVQGDAKKMNFSSDTFDMVIANSLVHHLFDPLPFWKELKRVSKPGGNILIRDLCRPETPEAARQIVERYAGTEPLVLKDLFFYSLRAAFTVPEIESQITQAGIKGLVVTRCSDRHWEIAGKLQK